MLAERQRRALCLHDELDRAFERAHRHPRLLVQGFDWLDGGLAGAGEVTHTAFSIPTGSIGYWEQRLRDKSILVEHTGKRFSEDVLTLADPDGMKIELVAHADAPAANAPRYADVPVEHSIRGFFGVTLLEHALAPTQKSLEVLGFKKVAEESNRTRFASPAGASLGNHIDVVADPKAAHGRGGAGTVHHLGCSTIKLV